MAGRKSSEKSLSRWREILRRQAASGVSIREFCATAGLSEPSFYAWRKKLRKSTKEGPLVGLSSPLFVPVKLRESASALEIIHPLGYRIQLTGEVDPVSLRQVIETLDGRGTR